MRTENIIRKEIELWKKPNIPDFIGREWIRGRIEALEWVLGRNYKKEGSEV